MTRPAPRWWAAALGLIVIAVALVGAASPFREGREYRRIDRCTDCPGFGREPVTIVGRRTFERVERHTDGDGDTYTTRKTVYEVTWERAGGARTVREVSRAIYAAATEGVPAHLRTWRGEVVGLEVGDAEQWFTPRVGWTLAAWLGLAWVGLGTLLWGLLAVRWDGVFMLVFRAFCWTMAGLMPATLAMGILFYGFELDRTSLIVLGVAAIVTAVPSVMLWSTFRDVSRRRGRARRRAP